MIRNPIILESNIVFLPLKPDMKFLSSGNDFVKVVDDHIDSTVGIPTILVTKPGLKKRDFQPVTGWERIRGCSVTIGSRRTRRLRAREPSACMCDECSAVRDWRYFCMGADRASYAA